MNANFERAAKIAALNDKCRSTGIQVVLTAGVNDAKLDKFGFRYCSKKIVIMEEL